MTAAQLSAIDLHVERVFGTGLNRSSARTNFPRVSFLKGYTKLTELRGYERVGQLYVLAFLLRTKRGRQLLSPRVEPDFENKKKEFRRGLKRRSTLVDDQQLLPSHPTDSSTDQEHSCSPHYKSNSESNGSSKKIWTVEQCLIYLRLETIQSLIYSKSLPSLLHDKLQSLLQKIFTDRIINKLVRNSEMNGLLPSASLLGYRPIKEVSLTHIQQHQLSNLTKMKNFADSDHKFQLNAENSDNSIRLNLDQLSYVVETLLTFLGY